MWTRGCRVKGTAVWSRPCRAWTRTARVPWPDHGDCPGGPAGPSPCRGGAGRGRGAPAPLAEQLSLRACLGGEQAAPEEGWGLEERPRSGRRPREWSRGAGGEEAEDQGPGSRDSGQAALGPRAPAHQRAQRWARSSAGKRRPASPLVTGPPPQAPARARSAPPS